VKWKRGADTTDVIDDRAAGAGGGRAFPGGARVGVPGGLGVVGLLIYLAIQLFAGGGASSAFNVDDPFNTATRAPSAPSGGAIPAAQDPDKDLKDFSVFVFDDVQQTWSQTFAQQGKPYERAKLHLYRSAVSTACGSATSAVGPFYCPGDQQVYLDLSFYKDMADKLGATGDFAWAYVIAHEMGHHIQQQLGISDQVERLRRDDPSQSNPLSVRLELQADCYAGVWAHSAYTTGKLEDGDIEEALGAAQSVGDDRLQRQATGTIRPDTFTHGSSAQRLKWFKIGDASGQPGDCDTFSVDQP